MNERNKYRLLQKGEIIQSGDEYDKSYPGEGYGWNAATYWTEVPSEMVGRLASDPTYPAHQLFRRRIDDGEKI